jgi:hypothetical protein
LLDQFAVITPTAKSSHEYKRNTIIHTADINPLNEDGYSLAETEELSRLRSAKRIAQSVG